MIEKRNNKQRTYLDFTKQEETNVCELYNNGVSTVKIGKMYNVSHKVIARILEKNNIKRTGVGKRKYLLDEYYFDNIDNQNKAYILGFIYADGSNALSKSTINISLQKSDKDILEKMRAELKSSKPLVFLDYSNKNDYGYHYKDQYALRFHSAHMCSKLLELGVYTDKSYTLKFPNFLRKDLLPHFIRGVFDGDGSISRYKASDKNHQINITITSTKDFCDELQSICQKELCINAGIYDASCKNGITKVFTIGGRNKAKIFLDWIYKDAELYLDRKYKRYQDYYANDSLSE